MDRDRVVGSPETQQITRAVSLAFPESNAAMGTALSAWMVAGYLSFVFRQRTRMYIRNRGDRC
jgi:hypothetical protein